LTRRDLGRHYDRRAAEALISVATPNQAEVRVRQSLQRLWRHDR
jgi:hypothetical protein